MVEHHRAVKSSSRVTADPLSNLYVVRSGIWYQPLMPKTLDVREDPVHGNQLIGLLTFRHVDYRVDWSVLPHVQFANLRTFDPQGHMTMVATEGGIDEMGNIEGPLLRL